MRAVSGFLLCQLAASVATASAAAPSTGYYYEATTTESGGKKGDATTKMRAWVEGPRARLEFLERTRKDLPQGSYLVTKDGGETVFLVNPKKKTFARWELDDAVNDVAERLKKDGGMVKLQVSDIGQENLLEEPSEPILGFPATHRRWSSGYTMKYALLGIQQERREDAVRDVWYSDRIGGAGFESLLSPKRLKTGHEGLDKVLAGKLGDPRGFTLRSETVTKVRKGKGEPQTLRARTEVTLLREEKGAPDLFEVPAGYAEKSFKSMR